MTGRLFNHVGFVVADMDEARRRFSEVLGLTFTEVTTITVDAFEERGREAVLLELDICYSLDGPPHYELIQATGDGVYGLHTVGGMHHIGIQEPDVDQRQTELEGLGIRSEATFRSDEYHQRVLAMYTEPSDFLGVRTELTYSQLGTFVERYLRDRNGRSD